VLRGSWFRTGYELCSLPMAPDEKAAAPRRFLDVTCDRAGDESRRDGGAGGRSTSALSHCGVRRTSARLLSRHRAADGCGRHALEPAGWTSCNIGVVANRSRIRKGVDEVAVQSETGWTLLELPVELRAARTASAPAAPATATAVLDPYMKRLADLRSGDRARVEAALKNLTRPDPVEVTQLLQLLAWDDLAPRVRLTLERVAPSHIGLLSDTLTDREIDFAIRRRIPKILGNVATADAAGRALTALLAGLEDPRFEVRYQCARAINRLMGRTSGLSVDRERIMASHRTRAFCADPGVAGPPPPRSGRRGLGRRRAVAAGDG
jgi:hypothetical protein